MASVEIMWEYLYYKDSKNPDEDFKLGDVVFFSDIDIANRKIIERKGVVIKIEILVDANQAGIHRKYYVLTFDIFGTKTIEINPFTFILKKKIKLKELERV